MRIGGGWWVTLTKGRITHYLILFLFCNPAYYLQYNKHGNNSHNEDSNKDNNTDNKKDKRNKIMMFVNKYNN